MLRGSLRAGSLCMATSPSTLDMPPPPGGAGGFLRRPQADGVLFLLQPARPPLAFQAAALLLAGLFGLPALAVALNPARHDGVSLAAAVAGVAVAALALRALLRARRNRHPRQVWLRPEGIETAEALLPWRPLAALRVVQPEAGPYGQQASGIHALAARIAQQQHAAEARLVLDMADGRPALLASGLGPEAAHALREALARDWPPAPPPQ